MHHGVLLLDKPSGITSHQLVQKVRKIFQQKKVGHCGTLDPLAEGLMVMTLGKACKLNSYLTQGDKTYDLTARFGVVTETLDREGRVLKNEEVHLNRKAIEQAAYQCLGNLDLPIPQFSAKKFQGKKLYEYARQGKKAPVFKKQMYFYNLKITSIQPNQMSCRLSCSKGSYVRAWVHYLGERLQTGGCLFGLKRTASAPYCLSQSFSINSLESGFLKNLSQNKSWIPLERILKQDSKLLGAVFQ